MLKVVVLCVLSVADEDINFWCLTIPCAYVYLCGHCANAARSESISLYNVSFMIYRWFLFPSYYLDEQDKV
jgi:hypothetical protein